jgi:hypothetical protein
MSDGKRKLAQLGVQHEHLDQPTIMNPALAAKYGAAYVRLVAFAIDVDRVYTALVDEEEEEVELPFAWEVFLTECYAVIALSGDGELERNLLEETCLSILEQAPDAQGYGSQLLFAVHDATLRGFYPGTLAPVFRSWRRPQKQLQKALDELWADADENQAVLAAHVLAVLLEPPVSPPTQKTLEQMAEGQLKPPRAPLPS